MEPPAANGTVVICGLGLLGQTCLLRLLPFDVPLGCLDLSEPPWVHPELEAFPRVPLTIGDMRRPSDLRRAGIAEARAVLLLSSSSSANLEAALQVRLLNPTARIVVRSSSQQVSLGALLEQRLPGMVVLDPLLLTAGAISQALRPGRQQACLSLDGVIYELVNVPTDQLAQPGDRRWQRERILPVGTVSGDGKNPGRSLVISARDQNPNRAAPSRQRGQLRVTTAKLAWPPLRTWPGRIGSWLRQRLPDARQDPLSWTAGLALLLLLVVGVLIFGSGGGWRTGLFVTLALLKGEFVDPLNVLMGNKASPTMLGEGLTTLSLIYALIGTLITSALVAIILEWLLTKRLGMRQPSVPRHHSSHVLLVEGGELAARVAAELRKERISVLRIQQAREGARDSDTDPVFPSVESALKALRSANLGGIGLLSEDLLANLHIALTLQHRWPQARVALEAREVSAAEPLGDLLGGMTVLSAIDLSADAIVATAFGEQVVWVGRVQDRTLMLVRYRIEPGDTLLGLTIARIQNGYDVTAISLRRHNHSEPKSMPSLDLVLAVDDELVVLASLRSLRRIERGRIRAPEWSLRLQVRRASIVGFETQQCLARHLGGSPGSMAPWLDGESHLTPPLDLDLARQLEYELLRRGIFCELESLSRQES
ncbi:NAD-binding protein [Cyanobium sp. Morenito 9A2]|uniref:NAD-binding protein n=1 Tax=Cyanobium sp. Morenito 9A2 TaxID=2823718 RepID=UPI0020CF3B5E|nr:NAD-binding protein [Cyanobium sp. Morenito 9A2]MCP9850108.1 NAD-binding protein [Cyanobium sp. Morenito 9A2]